ncbi:MAG TPA: hypothetical protein VJ838_15670 [Gaiellaceae bacterium]|jgi:hypothetical protein|nr:hypothetical protein [Gaiellaceae bacterium]
MQRHLYVVPRPKGSRPAKVVQLEVRRQLRREAERPQPEPPARPAA